MNNNVKIILSAVIAALVVSLLFLVVPVTSTFIASYIFALLAISLIAVSLCIYGKGSNKAPQGFGYINVAVIYAVVSTIFSVIACVIPLDIRWTVVVHAGILAVFVIVAVALSSGNQHIVKLDKQAEEKHKEFEKEKNTYWK